MGEIYWERKFWEPDIETMSRKELRELQKKKLFRQLIYAYENAPFYHELYDKEKVDVYKIKTIEDFQKYVPVIDKDMVREYRERTGDVFGGALCLPLKWSSFNPFSTEPFAGRFTKSTGTTGRSTYNIYTKNDVDRASNLYARSFWRAGCRPNQRVWNSNAIDWHPYINFTHLAYAKIGAITYHDATVMLLGVLPEELLEVIRDFDVEAVHLVARDARTLSRMAEEQGKTLKEAFFPNLKRGDLTGEIAMSMREYHAKCWGVTMTNLFAVSDPAFCGSSCNEGEEREVGRFMHMPEDEFFVEVLDPRTGQAVEGLEFGEPVITNLFFEAMAYIRWRTEDIADIRWDPCPYCGYTHVREFVRGRMSETIDVKDKLIPMGDVEDFVYSRPESRPLPVQVVREEPQPQDKLRVRLCYHENLVKNTEQYRQEIEEGLKNRLGVETSVELISPEEVRLAGGWKFVRVVKEKRQG